MHSVAALNMALHADPGAVYALLSNLVPCNRQLADDPHIPVRRVEVLEGEHFELGALSLINGVLLANGLPMVEAKWEGEGRERKLVGFQLSDEQPPRPAPALAIAA